MKQVLSSVLLGGAILLVGCSDSINSSRGTSPVSNSAMALAVGNEWTYERTVRDNPAGPDQVDTTVIKICDIEHLQGETWYVPCGYISHELWTNRDDGFWVKPDKGTPYLLFRYPTDNVDHWPGQDDHYTVNLFPPYGTYADIPDNGSFYSIRYDVEPDSGWMDSYTYVFTPQLGIATRDIYATDATTKVRYRRERLRLIDYKIPDPPVDTTGTISFLYYLDADSLPASFSLQVRLGMDAAPFGCLWYGFISTWHPEIPAGCYCPLKLSAVPDSASYTHLIEIPYVPSGTRDLEIVSTSSGGLDTLSSIELNSIMVTAGETTDLGRVSAFGD